MIANSTEARIRRSNDILVGLCLVFVLLFVPGAWAASPTETVTNTVDSVVAVLQDPTSSELAKKRQVKAIISKHFYFRAMSSRVLATNWKEATKRQRGKFTSLFKELLSNTYWRKISGYQDEKSNTLERNFVTINWRRLTP